MLKVGIEPTSSRPQREILATELFKPGPQVNRTLILRMLYENSTVELVALRFVFY